MPAKNRFFYGYVIVIMSFFVMMCTGGVRGIFGILFKPMSEDLEWTRAVTSGAFSISVIVAGIAGIVMGELNDRFGPRLVITICGILSGLGYALMSQIETVWQLYLFYGVLVGAGSNGYVPLLSTTTRWFAQRKSMMNGIVFAGSGVGFLILPLLVSRLISIYDWRFSCLIMGAGILLVVVLFAQFLKRDPGQTGWVVSGKNGSTEQTLQTATKDFSINEVVRTGQFWLFLVILALYGFCFSSLQVHIAPYATDIGFSATKAAGILSIMGGTTIIGQVGLGSVADKLGYKRAFLIGMILEAIAALLVVVDKGYWTLSLMAALLGLAFGDSSTVESPIAGWLFGMKSHGLILGLFAFSFTIGAAIGPELFGYLFDVTGNYQFAFLVCFSLSVIAVIMTIFLKRPILKQETSES